MFGKDRFFNILKYVAAGLSVVGLIAALYWVQHTQAKAQDTALALQEKARPYEQELRELEYQLDNTNWKYVYSRSDAELMVGFVLSDAADIPCIQSLGELYGFSPVAVLDCIQPPETIQALVEAVPAEWELMLFASASESAWASIAAVKAQLSTLERQDTGIVLLRSKASVSDGDLAAVKSNGFAGYTLYHDDPFVGQNEDNTVFFEYSSFKSTDYDSDMVEAFDQRLDKVHSSRAAMLCVFDMADLQPLETAEEKARPLLQAIGQYAALEHCHFTTVAEVTEGLSHINEEKAAYELTAQKEANEIRLRMAELKEIIREIYAGN